MKETYEEEGESGTNLGRVVRDDLSLEMSFKQSLEGRERATHSKDEGRVPGKMNCICKELGIFLKLK